jgi:hypothetical protein
MKIYEAMDYFWELFREDIATVDVNKDDIAGELIVIEVYDHFFATVFITYFV